MRVRSQLAFALAGLTGLTAATIVTIFVRESRVILYRQIESQVLTIAATGARHVDPIALRKILGPEDEVRPEYAVVQSQLRAIRDANRRADVHTRFVYTMRPVGGGAWVYGVDAEAPGPDHSPAGSPVEFEQGEELSLAHAYTEKKFSHDEFGTWLSANAPILDPEGQPIALLGVDLAASDVEAELARLFFTGLGAGFAALGVGIGLALGIAGWFTAPLERIGTVIRRIGEGKLDARAEEQRRDEFGALATAVNQMGLALRERNALKGALARYVSHEVADEILSGVPALRGARRQITALIVDIRNFSLLSARLDPEEVVAFLNRFFTRMIEVIFEHRGTLDKFLGDGCFAIFGAPLADDEHRRSAVRAAQAMLAAVRELSEDLLSRHGVALRIGIALHTGEAIVGNIGSEQRMEYTAIGDTVNVATRLEAMNKEFGTELLASEAVVRGAGSEFAFREVAEVAPRGTAGTIKIYTLAG